MGRLIIELRGVEFQNKGAELMLYAILEKLKSEIPSAYFVMEKRSNATISSQRKVGIYTKLNIKKFGIDTSLIGKVFPFFIRERFGFILESEINVVLDGSGFAFGDFWGAEKAGQRLANHIESWKRQGKTVIMLSQAFGPFEDPKLKEKMKVILNNADLIFARDNYSYEYLKTIPANQTNIHLRPDFTNLITGVAPSSFDADKNQIAIIPNNKLIESKVFLNRNDYIDFLATTVSEIEQAHKKPFFLIHEGVKDLQLAQDVNVRHGKNTSIIVVENPLEVKGIIGLCEAVITSRFHGLVSALSQAVPCLCVGWSHKYVALMENYNFSEGLIKNEQLHGENLRAKLELVLTTASQLAIRARLKNASEKQKSLSQDMWKMVVETIKTTSYD